MDAGGKRRFFDLLLTLGIKRSKWAPIGVEDDFDFVRTLVAAGPDSSDVTIAVLTQRGLS